MNSLYTVPSNNKPLYIVCLWVWVLILHTVTMLRYWQLVADIMYFTSDHLVSHAATSSSPLPKTATSPFTDELLCRETELAALEAFLKRHVCGKRPGSLYVSGPPGTGKSASINNLLDSRPVSLSTCWGL